MPDDMMARSTDSGGEYSDLLLLEDLESLLEDLEDAGATDRGGFSDLPPDLTARVSEADVTSLEELRANIAKLHTQLDSGEDFD